MAYGRGNERDVLVLLGLGKVKKIWNVSTLWFSFFELKNHVQFIFNTVLHPFFRNNNPKDYIDPTLPSNIALGDLKVNEKKALHNTYIYAISLAWSRSHQDGTGKPDMIPLVELFNGTSEKMNDRVPVRSRRRVLSMLILQEVIGHLVSYYNVYVCT